MSLLSYFCPCVSYLTLFKGMWDVQDVLQSMTSGRGLGSHWSAVSLPSQVLSYTRAFRQGTCRGSPVQAASLCWPEGLGHGGTRFPPSEGGNVSSAALAASAEPDARATLVLLGPVLWPCLGAQGERAKRDIMLSCYVL